MGDANLGEAATLKTDDILLRWFNHWLKDSGEYAIEARIRYFRLGINNWRGTHDWVEANHPLYLHSAGNANGRTGDGTLSVTAADEEESRDVFVYDPEVPVIAPGGPHALPGQFDQAALEMGNNLLVYSSAPVARETEIFGQPRINLYAITSATHSDFTAKLVRVNQSGRAEFLCIGIARSSWLFRESGYAPDQVHCWEFTLEPIAFVLSPGDRLRLEIASSAFPLYDRNPSRAVSPELADQWNWGRSTQQVLHTADNPSSILLPVKGESGW